MLTPEQQQELREQLQTFYAELLTAYAVHVEEAQHRALNTPFSQIKQELNGIDHFDTWRYNLTDAEQDYINAL